MQAYLHQIYIYFFSFSTYNVYNKEKVIETSAMMRRHVIVGHIACDR